MYKQVINTKINLKEFFDVYPPLNKEHSEESNKFIKLFDEPLRRGTVQRSIRLKKLKSTILPDKGLKAIKEKFNESINNISEKSDNSSNEKNNNDNTTKKYFLLNEGLKLQVEKIRRTHSIKKSLQNFLYKTNLIEKVSENLYRIENKISGGYLSKNDKNFKEKINSKISNIVEKLSNQLRIEKVKENKFIIKMNDVGDKCYFLLSGKLSILKPVEYKNIPVTTSEYIHYLVNLMKFNEISLINQALEINHIYINIEKISNLKIITKGFFLRKADSYLETFKTLTKEDFINLLDEFYLTFEDFKLNTEQTMKDIEEINNNTFEENNISFDSDSEKNEKTEKNEKNNKEEKEKEKETRSKYMIFKDYMNKFNLKVEERVVLTNFNFLFNPFEEKKKYNLTLFKYEFFMNLFPGSFFGDTALESKEKKRNATIRTEEECFILSLNNDDYIELLFEDNQKLKSMDLIFLTNKFFFNEISPVIFEKYYFAKFKYIEKYKGDVIYQQNKEFTSVLFLKKGEYKLEMKSSVIDIHNLIKFFIDMIEEKNYLKYSSKFISDLRETYLKDTELFDLKEKNNYYKEKFNEKYKLEISTVKQNEILGDLELFLTSGYINTCQVISFKAEYLEIKKQDLFEIFHKEKDILPNYYNFVMNKVISQIKRFYYLKNNLMNQIKSKVKHNFYQSMISPNFYNQKKNNNTNDYFKDKFTLKKMMPNVFKYSHFMPPTIYDSNWKPKFFEQEKNEVYTCYQNMEKGKSREKENCSNKHNINKLIDIKNYEYINNNDIIKTKQANILKNNQLRKVMEEISTTKTNNISFKNNFSSEKKDKNNNIIYQNKKSHNELSKNNIAHFNNNDNGTLVAGKYYLSLKKLNEELSDVENHDPYNLNIVNKLKCEKGNISSFSNTKTDKKNNTQLHSSSSNSFLPHIRLYKQKNLIDLYKRRENSSSIDKKIKRDNYEQKMELSNFSLINDEINIVNKMKISGIVKKFYEKHKKSGYSSIINKNNNRYYKQRRSASLN